MKKEDVIAALGALAQETRLDIFRYLVQIGPAGAPAGQIGERFGLPLATLSFHLKTLQQAGLLERERQSRSLIYSVNFTAMNALLAFLTENCCAGQPQSCSVPLCVPATINQSEASPPMSATDTKIYNVLFLCTGNSARSIIAEALLNEIGKGKFHAYSAGSHPTGKVNPLALEILERDNLPTAGLRSKAWDEFATPDSPELDFVFTVCDNAANEVCPVWPGQPTTAHWGVPDPAAVEGSQAVRMQAFRDTLRVLENRIKIFANLPIRSLDKIKLKKEVEQIGKVQPEHNA